MAENLMIAKSAEEAIRAKTPENVYIAGGTEVLRLGSEKDSAAYVSVRKADDMRRIVKSGADISIGAACTFQELAESSEVPEYLKEALLFNASRTRRNMATLGGNIALLRNDSYLIPTLIAAGASLGLLCAGESSQVIAIESYMTSADKYKDALITDVIIPAEGIQVKSMRSANTAQSHARLTASLSLKGGKYTAAVAVKNSGIYKLGGLASLLETDPSEGEIVDAVKRNPNILLKDDLLYGSADYRRYLIGITFALIYKELKGGRA